MYVKPGSDTYSTLCFRVGFRYEFVRNISKPNYFICINFKSHHINICICNETIFHLIVKSTLAKLCRVGIVYLSFLLTEMKCHGRMFSYRVQ